MERWEQPLEVRLASAEQAMLKKVAAAVRPQSK